MSQRTDEVQVKVLIDGKQGINELGKLEMEASDLKKSLKDMKKNTEEYVSANKKLDEVSGKINKLREELGLAGMTGGQLVRYAAELRSQLMRVTEGTAKYEELRQKLLQVNKVIDQQKGKLKESESVWQKLRKEAGTFGMLAVGYLGFEAITGKIGSIISGNAKLSDSLADIRKTTGMTTAEVKELNTSLSKINTRTANDELRKIAIVAGQLGIAKNQVLGFTDSIDKAVVALGDEFTGGAEEVAQKLGGLRGIFTDIKNDNVGDNLLKIGNAINELGASGAATGPVIADFSNRIGGVGITLGLTSGQVLGMSATLQELNVSAERGGTAVVKIMQKMTNETETFAKIAGKDVKVFEKMLNEDLYGAFKAVLEGSQKSASSATAFAAVLKDAELQGAGASEIFAKLGANTSLLDEKVLLANNSLGNTNSIMSEFSIKNDNLAAKLEKIQKWFAGAFTNTSVAKGLESMVGWFSDLIDNSEKLSVTMEKERVNINMLVIEMSNANTSATRRKEIYDELNRIAPQVVEGLDKENISYVKLRENLEKYNKEQINRIVIQKAQEKIDEQNQEVAKEVEKKLNAQKELMQLIAELSTKRGANQKEINKISQDENLTLEQKAKQILDLYGGMQAYDKAITMAGASTKEFININKTTDLTKLGTAYLDFQTSVERLNKEQDISNTLLKERLQIEDMLGVKAEESQATTTVEKKKSVTTEVKYKENASFEGKDQRELYSAKQSDYDKLIKQYEDFANKVASIGKKVELTGGDLVSKELDKIDQKYAELAQKAYDGKKAVEEAEFLAEEEKQLRIAEYEQQLALLESLKEEEKNQKKTEIEAEIDAKTEEQFDKLLKANNDFFSENLTDYNTYYDESIALLQKYGISTVELEKQRADQLIAINKRKSEIEKKQRLEDIQANAKNYATIFNIAGGYYSGILDLLDAFTSDSAKQTLDYVHQVKKYKMLELGANQAAAMASIVASAASHYTDPISFAADIGAGVAVVLKTIAQAKKIANEAQDSSAKIISDANSPNKGDGSYQSAGYKESGMVKKAKGGYSDVVEEMGSLYFKPSPTAIPAWINEEGVEYIVPNWQIDDPRYRPHIEFLERGRQRGFASGGFTDDVPAPAINTSMVPGQASSENTMLLLAVKQSVDRMNRNLENPKPSIAILDHDYFGKSEAELRRIQQNSAMG